MTKQQPTDRSGYAKLKTTAKTVESTIDVHAKGGYRPGWNNTHDTSQKPAESRLTDLAKKILGGGE